MAGISPATSEHVMGILGPTALFRVDRDCFVKSRTRESI